MRTVRKAVLVAVLVVGALYGVFAAAYALDDPGGWLGVGMVAGFVVPLLVLAWVALRRPEQARTVFTWVTLAFVAATLLDAALGVVQREDTGPVWAVALVVLALSLALLAFRYPVTAGRLLVLAAVAQGVSVLVVVALHGTIGPHGVGTLVGSSGGLLVIPLVVLGGLLWASGSADDDTGPGEAGLVSTRHDAGE